MKTKLSNKTLEFLKALITGESSDAPYRTGQDLINFFSEFDSASDTDELGFTSRSNYTVEKLKAANGTEKMSGIVIGAIDPRHFHSPGYSSSFDKVVKDLNLFLAHDGYEAVKVGIKYQLRPLTGGTIEANFVDRTGKLNSALINEHLRKSEQKLAAGDFKGCVTNSRSLLEALFLEIEKVAEPNPPKFDGDLNKLFKRVQGHLDIDAARPDIGTSVKQIISGLNSIVSGVSRLRNSASDAHGSDFETTVFHARLALNASKTLCDFFVDLLNSRNSSTS